MHQLHHSVVAKHPLSDKGRAEIGTHHVFPLHTCVPAYSGRGRYHSAMRPGKSFRADRVLELSVLLLGVSDQAGKGRGPSFLDRGGVDLLSVRPLWDEK